MATQLQIRRGTTAQMNAFTGAEGELAVNTTTDTLHVHDGATAGGKALARADGSNIATYAGSFSTLAASGAATLNTLASSGATLTGGTINGVTVGATIPSTGAFTTIAASGAITGNVTGNLTGSVLTAAQTNITSVGTLSTLAVTGTADVTLDLNVGGAVKGNAGTRVVSVGTAGSVIGGLQLWSTTAGASYVQFGDEAGTSANHYRGYMSYSHANDSMALGTSGSTKVTIGSSGSVGIGGSPSAPLHVKSSTGNAIFLLEHASPTVGTGQVSRFVSSTSNVTDVIDSNGYYRIGSSTAPNTGAGFTERMRIDGATGNVGIGAVPSAWRTAYADKALDLGTHSALYDQFGGSTFLVNNFYRSSNGDFKYMTTAGATAITLDSGSVGFLTGPSGTAGATATLTNRMTLGASGNFIVGNGGAWAAGADVCMIEASGLIDISRNDTGAQNAIAFYNPNGGVGQIRVSGSSVAYQQSSDYRLKDNVVKLTGATERLKQLNPSRFNFIADADTTVDGFLAHEVQAVVPEAIGGEKDAMKDEEYEVTPAVLDNDGNVTTQAVTGTRSVPDYQGIDQSKLVPLLVATIQELEARLTALENN